MECYGVVPNIAMLYNNPMKWWEYLVNWRMHTKEYKGNQDVNMIRVESCGLIEFRTHKTLWDQISQVLCVCV